MPFSSQLGTRYDGGLTTVSMQVGEYKFFALAAALAGLWRLPCCLRGGVTTGDAHPFLAAGGFSGGVSLAEPLLPAR